MQQFQIRRQPPYEAEWIELGEHGQELDAGDILVEIELLAFTANNISYLQMGDFIGYWKLFPLEQAGRGLMPAMGNARVVASRRPDIAEGERLWGFFPLATHLRMHPGHVQADRFHDLYEHRAAMYDKMPHMRAYQRYFRLPAKQDFVTDHEGIQAALRGQFITSFLMDLYLRDKALFGARQLLFTSASSRTALAGAWLAGRSEPALPTLALTSARNADFVTARGVYQSVTAYEDLDALDASVPTACVDVAGDGALLKRVHRHFGDNLRYSGLLGKAHPAAAMPPQDMPGPQPRMFFAPQHIESRNAQWGAEEFDARLTAVWKDYERWAATWLSERDIDGTQAVAAAYAQGLRDGFDPGRVLILRPNAA